MKFVILWEASCVAGNPKVNPEPEDRNKVLCAGFCPIEAKSADEAKLKFATAFPDDRIVGIR